MLRWYLSWSPHFYSDWLWPYCGVKYSEHINFLLMGIQCFCKTFSLPQHFFSGTACIALMKMQLRDHPYITYNGLVGWVVSENVNFCWRSALHLYWHSGWVQIVQKCTDADVLHGWSLWRRKKECRSQIIFQRQTYLVDGPQGHHQNSHQKICYTQTEDQIVGHTLKVALQDDSRNNKYISCKKWINIFTLIFWSWINFTWIFENNLHNYQSCQVWYTFISMYNYYISIVMYIVNAFPFEIVHPVQTLKLFQSQYALGHFRGHFLSYILKGFSKYRNSCFLMHILV
jgi:hypothetical protein